MFDKEKMLNEIFSSDTLGLLNVKVSNTPVVNEDQRLISTFEEINTFFEVNKKEPEQSSNITERSLYARLKGIRSSPEKIEMLQKYDRFSLLSSEKLPKIITSINDVLEDDIFGILESKEEDNLFDLKHVKTKDEVEKERESTDFVARRKPCKDFDKYEPLFKKVQEELKNGKRKIVDFRVGNLQESTYYIQNGILFYLEKIAISKKEHYRADGTRVREDGRTRCIFENGTESNMLKRSVEKILYANGQVVSHSSDSDDTTLQKNANLITDEDKEAGFIYILKSKSTKQEIREIQHLYKIGYSTTPVKDRIKNASIEPTYLMAEVEIIAEYQTYNMNTQKFEQLLHNFFGKACLNMDVFDNKGKRHTPQEWFIAPIHIIDQAIDLIVSGEIINFKYDFENERIEEKEN
jgi:hypothetical protein